MMQHAMEFAALIGIDWSDRKHDICLVDTATGSQELSVIRHTPEDLDEWARCLRKRFGGGPVAVCLEQSRGPLIYALLKYDFLVLYPVNPQTLSKFREAFTPSRAKDDPRDAEFLVELLLHHRKRLKAWLPDDESTRELQLLVEHRRRLVGDRTRTSNRLTALLKGYFPQVLQWFPDIAREPRVRLFAQMAEPRFAQRRTPRDIRKVLPRAQLTSQGVVREAAGSYQSRRAAHPG